MSDSSTTDQSFSFFFAPITPRNTALVRRYPLCEYANDPELSELFDHPVHNGLGLNAFFNTNEFRKLPKM